ncbi:MAG: aldo/keto reductase [Advenella sp.]|nr:aldo/keto reductase [Advenella sp.]
MNTQRTIGGQSVFAIGLGCMNLSHAYGVAPDEQAGRALLEQALAEGINHFDTATLYGFGKNESLVGKVLKPHRQNIFLASKCGMGPVDGKRVIDGRPETLKRQCEESLQRLQTDVIDLYYLHRWDKKVPIEESVGALSELVSEGKIRFIGLSEVSAATIKKAHQVHPVTAVQNEYSLWSRNPELGALAACREIGANLVAFSPVARGFLGNKLHDLSVLPENDIRLNMPRFSAENYPLNLRLLADYAELAKEANCTPAQLALAWLLAQDEQLIPIPGTTRPEHLLENIQAASLKIDAAILARAGRLINQETVVGNRYATATLAEIDTESFA